MMMKKKLAALLLAAASAMVFTGCGSSDNQSKGGVDKKVQIEYWHVASESFGGTTVKELVADFNAKHPNIQVVEKYNPDMYKGLTQNLQAAIASGKNPDVVQMGWSYLNYAAENLKYTDLQPMIEKQAPEDKNFLKENYLPNVLALAQTDDGKQIKEKTGNMGFFMQEYADNWTQQAIIESNGGSMLKNEGGKVKAGFDTPEAAAAYQLLADMVKDGNGLHATNEEGFQAYLSGKLGMVCTTIGKRANFEKSAKFKVMAAPFPQFEGKELKVPAGGNFLMLFSKDADKQKAAWEFIKYIESPEALAKWSTGTGYLPPRKGVADDPNGFKKMIEENKNIQVALSTMPNLVKWASFPGANGLQAEQLLIDARDIILSGKETAAQALHETAEKINNLL